MPNYPHDPEFPYLIVGTLTSEVYGKFNNPDVAQEVVGNPKDTYLTVVDTTPAPLPTKFGAIVKSGGWRYVLVDRDDFGNEWRREAMAEFMGPKQLQAEGFEVLFEGLDDD